MQEDFLLNNQNARRRLTKFSSQHISKTVVLPKLRDCASIFQGFDGWRKDQEWYIHCVRVVIAGRGAAFAYPLIYDSYTFHGADFNTDILSKFKHIRSDQAAINQGRKSGIKNDLKMKSKGQI